MSAGFLKTGASPVPPGPGHWPTHHAAADPVPTPPCKDVAMRNLCPGRLKRHAEIPGDCEEPIRYPWRCMPVRLLLPILRFFFRHLYTTLAWSYDLVANASSMGQWYTWQEAALQDLPARGPILELGHGTGHLLKRLVLREDLSVGVDSSKQMSNLAARRLRAEGKRARLARARAQALPFPDRTFEALVSTFPSEFILEHDALTEACRVLRSKGMLVVVLSARITGRSLPDRFAAWLYRVTGQSGAIGDGWRQVLRQAGLAGNLQTIRQPRAEVLRLVATKLT